MPVIQVNLLEGRSREAKRAFAAAVTKSACECLGVKPTQVRVIFHEVSKGDWAVAGTLYSDMDEKPGTSSSA
ncbi:MAG: 2-hydroxymuconate tautomerase family protein [Synergistaceae bacterium]|jgi:4-oxalocrotonate tautomerase|nr:2-hydroxymuconate tautomerase family protein [Synergistaceae bacterium]